MQYLCLVYGAETALDALSKREMEGLVDESLAYDDVLRKSGHYLVSAALQRVETAKTVRVRDRKRFITDAIRRDEGTVARIHPDRSQRPE
jgi:hypothetical protein